MVWDYNDRTPPLRPPAARLRFLPPRVLGAYKIPHAIWGDDASICHEVPTFVWDSMQILVPRAYLKQAATRLSNNLRVFEETAFPPDEDLNRFLPRYSDDCILLASRRRLRMTANYIILIPDEVFHFDVTDPTSVQGLPDYFKLPVTEFGAVRVPSFPALMNALLQSADKSRTQNFSGCFRDKARIGDLRGDILLRAMMLVAWRQREPWEHYYNNPEEYSIKLKEIRDCLSSESVSVFDNIFTKAHNVDDDTKLRAD
ncbi:hypothetical protein TWF281_002453 [Arthrobotrys megalospora]